MKNQKKQEENNSRPIGVFDSGVGGLTVVKELINALPHEDIIYYGDTARVPYGAKSRNTIIKFSIENARFLMRYNVKIIVVACNTSSSFSLPVLKKSFNVPVAGVIRPGAIDALKASNNRRIGIIGTSATIKSNSYSREIARIDPSVKIFQQYCPLLVPAAEEPFLDKKIVSAIVKYYLVPLKKKKIDTLVLGCTHYPILKDVIADVMGNKVTLVDSAVSTTAYIKNSLIGIGALNKNKTRGISSFFVSDEIDNFRQVGERFLHKKMDRIRKAGYGLQG